MANARTVRTALLLAMLVAAPTIAAATALPDTGLFAPVAEQLRARLARIAALPDAGVSAERLRLLLETGQPDEGKSVV